MIYKVLILFTSLTFNVYYFYTIKNNRDVNTSDELFQWSSTNRLTWDMFKGNNAPESFKNMAAVSIITLKIENELYSLDSISLDVISYFVINKSWKSQFSNLDLLNHEQRHFDLHEIYSRKLRKKISSYKIPQKPEEFKWTIDKLRFKIRNDFLEISTLYDEETDHGAIKHEQAKWDKLIDSVLIELKDYEVTRVTIRR